MLAELPQRHAQRIKHLEAPSFGGNSERREIRLRERRHGTRAGMCRRRAFVDGAEIDIFEMARELVDGRGREARTRTFRVTSDNCPPFLTAGSLYRGHHAYRTPATWPR